MTKVLLLDVDSKIENLPLMKLSACHKERGDEVVLSRPGKSASIDEPDVIYASVIFSKNRHRLDGLRLMYPEAVITIGGSGNDLRLKLPDEVENHRPDYDLYPGMRYSMGFTTRGCIRRCHFCLVHRKEGRLQRWHHPREFHDDRFNSIRLMDNNWLADRRWFFETSQWIIDRDLELIEGGLDIRLVDDEIAEQLKQLRCKVLHFAWDYERDEAEILAGIEVLKRHGINTKQGCRFYVYVEDDSQYDSGVRRCRILKQHRCTPMGMVNPESKMTKRLKRFQRWSCNAYLIWSCDIDDYDSSIKGHTGMVPEGRRIA